MERFEGLVIRVPIPASVETPDAGRAHEWLTDKGADLAGVSIDERSRELVLELNDPTQEQAIRNGIAAYGGQKTRREQFKENAIEDAKPIIKAIAQKTRANRSNVEKAILGLAVLLSEELDT